MWAKTLQSVVVIFMSVLFPSSFSVWGIVARVYSCFAAFRWTGSGCCAYCLCTSTLGTAILSCFLFLLLRMELLLKAMTWPVLSACFASAFRRNVSKATHRRNMVRRPATSSPSTAVQSSAEKVTGRNDFF